MVSVAKCLSIVGVGSFIGAAGTSYYTNRKLNKITLAEATAHAKNGQIPIGGMTKDGKLWDGQISVDEFKKKLEKNAIISSAIQGGIFTVGTLLISGLTLALRGKMPKVKG